MRASHVSDGSLPGGTQRMESHITVSRTSPDDVQQRQIIVKLDGEHLAELMYGQSVTRAVAPGNHRLRVDNTGNWKTVEFDLAPAGDLKFRTHSRPVPFQWFLFCSLA